MSKPKLIAALVAILLVLIIALQNTRVVETNILFFSPALPLAILMLLTFTVGIIAGLLMAVTLSGRRKRKAKAKSA